MNVYCKFILTIKISYTRGKYKFLNKNSWSNFFKKNCNVLSEKKRRSQSLILCHIVKRRVPNRAEQSLAMEGGREELLWKSEPEAESIVSVTLARAMSALLSARPKKLQDAISRLSSLAQRPSIGTFSDELSL